MFKHTIRIFLCLFFVQTFIVDASCSCTSDSNCNDGEYCETDPFLGTSACSPCNHPDNTYSWSWVTNGQRQGTGINSCQWKIQCDDKPNFLNGTWAPDDEYPTGYGSTVSDNNEECKYTKLQNIICNAGYYRKNNNNTCVACAAGTYKSNADNSTSCINAENGYYVDTPGATSQTPCPPEYSDGSDGQRTNITNCYATKNCVLTQQEASCPDNATCQYDACSDSSCTIYKQYVNASGNGDGTYSGGKKTETCTKPVNNFTCNAGYYEDGNECTMCPYGSTSGIGAKAKTQCYFQPETQIRDLRGTYTVPSGITLYLVQ